MKHYRLHEAAKFLAGIVLADFITEWWLWSQGLLPVNADWEVPVWLSWIGTLITAYLSYMSFHLAARVRR